MRVNDYSEISPLRGTIDYTTIIRMVIVYATIIFICLFAVICITLSR